ncbi:MAG: hypothetical protein L3J82_08165 [Planctomycetes bacterium]|nr:hypothetical protein [Planctomycetota bacterium]
MHGLITGGIMGMGFLALMAAWRTVRNYRDAQAKPAKVVFILQVALQVAIGFAAIVAGVFFMLAG